MAKVNRFEINKLVRRVLTKNQVDMSTISFTCIGGRILLSGLLKKGSGGEFTASGIESMLSEMRKIKGVSDVGSELGNWDLNGGSITKVDKGDGGKGGHGGEKKAAR
jgi:hypothetical protein